MAISQIAARLDNVFRLLTGGSRSVQHRQQTLATMDWSYACYPNGAGLNACRYLLALDFGAAESIVWRGSEPFGVWICWLWWIILDPR
jgi:hypothetical protein